MNLGLHQPDVSVVWDLGPHDFSILRYWLGETPCHVSALSRGCIIPGIPDVAFINLEFGSGTIAHVELSWLAPSKLRRTTVVGSREDGRLRRHEHEPVRDLRLGRDRYRDPETFGEYKLSYRTGDIVSPRVDAAEPLSLEMSDFCHGDSHGSTHRARRQQLGLEVVRMMEGGRRVAGRRRAELASSWRPLISAPLRNMSRADARPRACCSRRSQPYLTVRGG